MEELEIVLQGTKQELMERIPALMDMYSLLQSKDVGNIYGIPVTTFQDRLTFHPQIKLMFYQSKDEAKPGFPRVTGEITYRVPDETSETFTESNARLRAQKIKDLFVNSELFVWQKGREIVSYLDKQQGYNFRLNVKNELEGRKIIMRVMSIENKLPNWNKLCLHECRNTFPDTPSSQRVYGEQRRMPRRRLLEDIKFRYAELHLWGLTKPVTLVDTSGHRGVPLVRAL